jgi:hypothetical protein
MIFSLRPYRIPWSFVGLGMSLLLIGAGIGVQGMTSANSRPSTVPTLATPVDPFLVPNRQTVFFSGTIADNATLNGTISPSLPGLNTMSLNIMPARRQVAWGGQVTLVITMPEMAMPPVRATLSATRQGYRGMVALPMFGTYRVQADASTGAGQYTGAFSLTLPLTLGSLPPSDHSAHP